MCGWLSAAAARASRQNRSTPTGPPITPLVEANTFKAIPGIGPTTDRIARELIHEGGSPFVERAVLEAGQEQEVARLRGLRQHFLSHAAVGEILSRRGSPSRARYRGD